MAKYLSNNSLGVICIGAVNLIPGAGPTEVPASALQHPNIKAKLDAGILTLTSDDKPATVLDPHAPADHLAAAGKNVAKLKAYAAKANIDLGDARTADDIIAIIKTAEAKAGE